MQATDHIAFGNQAYSGLMTFFLIMLGATIALSPAVARETRPEWMEDRHTNLEV